ncbi:MAG: cytochrome c maturation protein CcmE [Candidatus Aquicultorales bacterium]
MIDKKSKKRLIIITVILLAAVGFLVYSNVGSAAYMRTIEEVQKDEKYVGSTVRVTGKSVKGTIERKGTTYRFDIKDKGKTMTVEYSGSMPSTFGPDIQVIALGKLVKTDELKATEIVTKCPSKYEAKKAEEAKK